jgi:hypothetical protein
VEPEGRTVVRLEIVAAGSSVEGDERDEGEDEGDEGDEGGEELRRVEEDATGQYVAGRRDGLRDLAGYSRSR